MGKNKDQGTAWETATKEALERLGFEAERLAEGGKHDKGDVRAVKEPRGVSAWALPLVVVNWKRLVKREGKRRRVPDGERDVVVMRTNDFYHMLRVMADYDVAPEYLYVECKASEYENITRVLKKARRKVGL